RSHPALRPSGGAAFSIDAASEERLIIVQELEYRAQPDLDAVVTAIRQAVADEHEVFVSALLLIAPGTLPKTASGKVQRGGCRELFLTGTLDVVAEWRGGALTAIKTENEFVRSQKSITF